MTIYELQKACWPEFTLDAVEFLLGKAILQDGTIRRIKHFTSVTSPWGTRYVHDCDFIDLEDPEDLPKDFP